MVARSALTTSDIPHPDALVITRANQPAASGVESQCSHEGLVAYECAKTFSSRSRPNFDLAVVGARDDEIVLKRPSAILDKDIGEFWWFT